MSRDKGVSVVMATYNGAAHVGAQLASIVGQTFKPLEILIGDDGSTDSTLEVIRSFAAKSDVPIRLTENATNLGYAENFLRTSAAAKGDLIAFSDQDDVWFPDKLAAGVAALAAPDVMMWISGWRLVDENLDPIPDHRFHTGFVQKSALAYPMHVPHGARAVFRTELLDRLPAAGRSRSVFGDWPAHHDEWVLFAAHVFGRVDNDATPRMLYRRHATTVSGPDETAPSRRHLISKSGEAADDDIVLAARGRATYLRDRAASPEGKPVRTQLLRAADYYDQLVPRLTRRSGTQTAASRAQRVKSLLRGVAKGDYRSLDSGGLGFWVLVQDGYGATLR